MEAAGEGNAKVDFLVNCAGMYQEEALQDITEASYSKMMDENVKSTIFLTKAVLSLLSDDSPSILNIASDAALEGNYAAPFMLQVKGLSSPLPVPRRLISRLGSALTASAPVMSIRPL